MITLKHVFFAMHIIVACLLQPTFADLVKYLEDVNDWDKLGVFYYLRKVMHRISVIKKTHE